jgi:hypothetical protein
MRPAKKRIEGVKDRPKLFLRVYYGDADKSPDFDPLDPDPSSAYALGAAATFRSGRPAAGRASLRIAA